MPTNINNKKPNTLIINMLRNFNVELADSNPRPDMETIFRLHA